MALSKGAKVGIGIAVGGGLLLLAGGASAAGGTGNVELPPRLPTVDPPVEPPVEPPPPPPPTGAKKNFVGSGWNWPHRNRFPNVQSFITFLNVHGYFSAAIGQNITSEQNRTAIRAFQRDFNKVRTELKKTQPVALGNIATDGLIGVGTINAMLQAEVWVNQRATPWQGLVNQANG